MGWDNPSSSSERVIAELVAASNLGLIGSVRLQDAGSTNQAAIASFPVTDGQGAVTVLGTTSFPDLFNNVTWDRARSASAANLIAQSGLGAALVAPPGNWSIFSVPAVGAQATATRAAGAAGVRHVMTAAGYGYGATTALVAAVQRLFNLRDGATGVGTVIKQLGFALPAAAVVQTNNDAIESRSLPGTAATAMTAEFDAATANLFESVEMDGYDVS